MTGPAPRLLTHDGATLRISEWAARVGLHKNTVRRRIGLGWSVERALTAKVRDNPDTIWTAERTGIARALWAEGKTGTEIANVLGHGITRCAVLGKMHRLGLTKSYSPNTVATPFERGAHAR